MADGLSGILTITDRGTANRPALVRYQRIPQLWDFVTKLGVWLLFFAIKWPCSLSQGELPYCCMRISRAVRAVGFEEERLGVDGRFEDFLGSVLINKLFGM